MSGVTPATAADNTLPASEAGSIAGETITEGSASELSSLAASEDDGEDIEEEIEEIPRGPAVLKGKKARAVAIFGELLDCLFD